MSSLVASRPSLAERYAAEFPRSRQLHDQARGVFPHGVTHDARHLEPFPVYADRAARGRKWTVEGKELVDYWSGHGALLLGHSHPAVVEAVQRQMAKATHPGACHESEIEWGRLVQRLIPSAETVRFTSSGTEATLMALRLARIFTGRPKVLKFAGHFHGWHDFVIPAADPPYELGRGQETTPQQGEETTPQQEGRGQETTPQQGEETTPQQEALGRGLLTTPQPPGVPPEVAALTVVLPPNDAAAVERALESDPQIGCVILEPTGGHWGAVPIRGPFLHALREITARRGRLLIFDEVITGFRVAPGGAQQHYGVRPDVTTLAKIVAGGLPGGCVAGRGDILNYLEFRPGKPKMKHPGTFNANPLSASAGIAALRLVATGEPCRRANETGRLLRQRLNALFAERDADWIAYGEFSFFRLLPGYRGPRPDGDDFIPYNGDLNKLDGPRDVRLTQALRIAMLLHGVDFFGTGGMTTAAHTEEDVERTVAAVAGALDLLREEGLA